jgi:ribosomal protein L33
MIRHTEKNVKNTTDKLELNKYCPKCHSVQAFKEAKIGK